MVGVIVQGGGIAMLYWASSHDSYGFMAPHPILDMIVGSSTVDIDAGCSRMNWKVALFSAQKFINSFDTYITLYNSYPFKHPPCLLQLITCQTFSIPDISMEEK